MARTLVAELERELRGIESGLRILATSEELQQGKLGAFHRRLQDALQLQNVDGYVLLDNHDMLVANSSAPIPVPDQKRPAGRDPAAGRSPQGVVTNLFNTALRGEQTIAVGIPVTLQGQVQYSLFAEIRPQRISQILRRQALPAGWVAAALDKEALIVGARAKKPGISASMPCRRWPMRCAASRTARCTARPRRRAGADGFQP